MFVFVCVCFACELVCCFFAVGVVKIWCSWFVVLVCLFKAVRVCRCSKLCVRVDSSSLDTISRGAWPFLIGRVTCLSDLVSVRAVKKRERNRKRKRHVRRETHTTPHAHTTQHTHKTTHPTHHSTFLFITVTTVTPVTSVILMRIYCFRFNIKL